MSWNNGETVFTLPSDRTAFSENHVINLEQWIDKLDHQLPELKNFILPVRFTPTGFMSYCSRVLQLHSCVAFTKL